MTNGFDRIHFMVDRSLIAEPSEVLDLDNLELPGFVSPNLKHHYSGLVCARRWLDVCRDPVYGHGELIRLIGDQFPGLFKRVRESGKKGRKFMLVSFGPGDGAVDHCLLRQMSAKSAIASYLGLDSSFELLRIAMNRLGTALDINRGIPLNAVCGDFRNLRQWTRDDVEASHRRLFSLTGFTLGNYPEAGLLSSIKALMNPEDYLLLDARTLQHGRLGPVAPEDAMRNYMAPSVRRFVFGPLEVATRTSVEEVDIVLETHRSITCVPGAVNIVFLCRGLDTTQRFTGQRVKVDRLDLAATTLYEFDALKSWLAASGFELVGSAQQTGIALFLLRHSPEG
jgi:hypothetical protein